MGQSTDAILFYGFHVDEESFFGEYDNDFEAFLLAKSDADLQDPWDELPSHEHLPYDDKRKAEQAWIDKNRDRIDLYNEQKKAAIASVSTVRVDFHCSDDYGFPYFYVAETTASRGYPEKITSLEIPEGADEKLRALAKLMDIGEPEIGWFLVSYWG